MTADAIREAAATELARAHEPDAAQAAVIQGQLAPAVAQAASKNAPKDTAA